MIIIILLYSLLALIEVTFLIEKQNNVAARESCIESNDGRQCIQKNIYRVQKNYVKKVLEILKEMKKKKKTKRIIIIIIIFLNTCFFIFIL